MPRLLGPDPDLPTIVSRAAARAAGLSDDQIAYRLATGVWQRVSLGHYRRSDWAPELLDERARIRLDHVHRSVIAVRRNPGTAIGFQSAATILGLPLASALPGEVTLVVPPGHWTGTRHGIRFRQGVLEAAELSPFRIRVTSAVRTWVDIARTMSPADALVAGDAALRSRLVERQELMDAIAAAAGSRGYRRAAAAVGQLDGRRESPLESQSWAYFVAHRVDLPDVQVEVRSAAGRFVARVDVLWRTARLVGECDGRLKYQTAEDVYAEKRREDEIRAEGFAVMRWGAADLRTADLARRLRRALA